jgi:diguanylate cyclase (GGDEF)-like protein
MAKEKLTVLVAEDQRINRQILAALLSPDYTVLEAENGAVALEQLTEHPEVAAILLDIVMPVMDGYEFLACLKKTPSASLPVIAITGEQDEDSEQRALTLGAWDFVSKPYRPATLLTRLKNVIIRSQYYLVSQMKRASEHDPLTDLYNRTAFFAQTRKLLDEHRDTTFAMVRFDIDQFHTYNSFWGEEEGDRLICFIANQLRLAAERCAPCVYGRISGDVFCMCLPWRKEQLENSAALALDALSEYNREYRILPSFGVCVIRDAAESVQKLYEFASLAARESKGSCLEYIGYYRPEMSERILENQRIVNEMQGALDGEQFEVFLQPKFNLSSGQPYGAEALVRWRHPEKGLLSPGLFIPVLEQNGFIGRVDCYMWEHVCRLLQKWLSEGREPGPISVNVSRVNMYNRNLVGLLSGLVEKYGIPPRLLHLEVTESAYMENPEVMERVVDELQNAGFVILMDDFGSGYSSLNTLKDIHVDVLKIDMKFLSGTADPMRSRSILASSILMAGWLNTPVIMEGVETAEQVEFLKSIGCNYVQGYYYARPMPVPEYEALIAGARQTPTSLRAENLKAVRGALWSEEPGVELLFNSLEEPAAVCALTGGRLRVLRVNRSFRSLFGTDASAGQQPYAGGWERLSGAGAQAVLDAFNKTAKTKSAGSCVYQIRTRDGSLRSIRAAMHYWGTNGGAEIVFAQYFRLEDERPEACPPPQ